MVVVVPTVIPAPVAAMLPTVFVFVHASPRSIESSDARRAGLISLSSFVVVALTSRAVRADRTTGHAGRPSLGIVARNRGTARSRASILNMGAENAVGQLGLEVATGTTMSARPRRSDTRAADSTRSRPE